MPEQQHAVPQQEISNGIAQLYKSRLGRGPTKVTTSFVGDLVVCVLEDTDTPYEETLVELGGRELVHEGRRRFQQHCAAQMVAVVQEATGRAVRGHVPGFTAEIDVATEVFLLEDVSEPAGSGTVA